MVKSTWFTLFTLIAILLTLIVIGLGAFTRLIDAGLGCPDWPGCYGHLVVPMNESTREIIKLIYPETPLVSYKAWAEMIHRYAVSGLSLFIVAVILFIFIRAREKLNVFCAVSLIFLLIYQILLGRWTVTLKLLPIVVTQHLLGGFLILSFLWIILLNSFSSPKRTVESNLLPLFAFFGIVLLLLQIFLGAWTSTNYASLSCPDFPFCMNHESVPLHFAEAFNLKSPLDTNYEGGVLSEQSRQTIHMVHRVGALILTTYIICFFSFFYETLKQSRVLMGISYIIFGLVMVQISLGISNVMFKLPLMTAIGHNLVASFLLLAFISLTFYSVVSRKKNLP